MTNKRAARSITLLIAMSASVAVFADRFGISEADSSPVGSMTAYWVILALVVAYFCYRSLVHNESFEIVGVAVVAAILGLGFGILNFVWLVISK